jgi:hypothetical protein
MSATVAHFANIFTSGSAHMFNCRDLSRKVDQAEDGKLMFDTTALNRAVFLKLPASIKENDLKRREKLARFETKVYLPFEDQLDKGGHTISFSDPGFYDAIRSLRNEGSSFNNPAYERDREILQLIQNLPSLDPFLLKERFAQAEMVVDERYFSVTPEEWQRIRHFVTSKFKPMISFAYPERKPDDAQVNRLTQLMWEAKDEPDVTKMLTVLNIPVNKVDEILYSWKGIIYYEYVYLSQSEKVKELLKWFDNLGTQLGVMTPVLKIKRDAIRRHLADNVGALLPVLREHRQAYDELFIHRRDAKPFVAFMSDCSKQFGSLSKTLGQVMIMLNIWQNFSLRGSPYKATLTQVNSIIAVFEHNIL